MRGIVCRGLRLELVAALGFALAMPVPSMAAASVQSIATQTTMTVETHDQGGNTQASVAISVSGADGLPAAGTIAINDYGRPVAGVALNSEGQATTVLSLQGGMHSLAAAYTGDATHLSSISQPASVTAQTGGGTPDFQISISPATETLKVGQSGTVIASVTPINGAGLTAPMFVTLSCSGLPDQSSCTFTPESVEIQPGASAAVTSSLVIETQAASTSASAPAARLHPGTIAWAILLPGALGLGGLAWGTRRRPWLNRFMLLALVGLVTMLGTTACNPRYYYYNHGPPATPATPTGSYTINVTAQSSNGVTAITHSTTLGLTVQ